ncbi:MAG: L,D-transpeptidase family protein [Hyphomicrobiaceae bacterium]
MILSDRWRHVRFGLLAIALLMTSGQPPVQSLEIELGDAAADRIERQRAFVAGALPLPGTPDVAALPARLAALGVARGDPIFIRIFKAESELELWIRKGESLVQLATYPICHWSGGLGPKLIEGDRQTPEGFYTVTRHRLHRAGRWPRSLDLGFPNAHDRALRRTGSYILVHGGCSSVGCFAMTNEVMAEIYGLAEQALRQGQQHIHVHVFPFRMTEQRLAAAADHPWATFWQSLKPAYDLFETTGRPPLIGVCESRYVAQAAGPGEVADPGPLAPCGASLLAMTPPNASPSLPPPSSMRRRSAGRVARVAARTPPQQCRHNPATCRKSYFRKSGGTKRRGPEPSGRRRSR